MVFLGTIAAAIGVWMATDLGLGPLILVGVGTALALRHIGSQRHHHNVSGGWHGRHPRRRERIEA